MWNGTYSKFKWVINNKFLSSDKNLTQCWQIWKDDVQDKNSIVCTRVFFLKTQGDVWSIGSDISDRMNWWLCRSTAMFYNWFQTKANEAVKIQKRCLLCRCRCRCSFMISILNLRCLLFRYQFILDKKGNLLVRNGKIVSCPSPNFPNN